MDIKKRDKGETVKCFICGEFFVTSNCWKQDYCEKHDDNNGYHCTSRKDWGNIMELKERGYIE